MVLSDEKLLELITSGYLPADVHLGPCSVDLTLGKDYLIPYLPEDRPYITTNEDDPHKLARVEDHRLHWGQTVGVILGDRNIGTVFG